MNKFELMNKVTVSGLAAPDKTLLLELILRADDNGYSWPSVQRLCMARGIKHEKNFKGADAYLPGVVTKQKKGRKMTYTLNAEAIMALEPAHVVTKHTPPLPTDSQVSDDPSEQGSDTPESADNTPAQSENDPVREGANSTKNTTTNSTVDNTITSDADASSVGDTPYCFEEWEDSLNFEKPPSITSDSSYSWVDSTGGTAAAGAGAASGSDEPEVRDTVEDILARLDPETRAKVMRGSEVPRPVYASWEEKMAARMR